jgi:hypothetical protein
MGSSTVGSTGAVSSDFGSSGFGGCSGLAPAGFFGFGGRRRSSFGRGALRSGVI